MFEHTMYCSTCQDTRGFYRPWTAEEPAVEGTPIEDGATEDRDLEDGELACGVCGTALLIDPVLYAGDDLPVRQAA